ncbi:Ribosomal protein S12 methylthiotransferase RimO [Anaerohalosphaera lusitana]|uniref:Ribosomal protein uS12 methylthiotransferase RimO n=1 Tax=Anaerohalosphaera lusitana TaxID=1936003 RepID=A0A1U9NIS3_9BACT|nr:30S ribosomal protein S12 methylthiotransferase RimO [Anaerohalosphaera lusitana]AQT67406.1 Ribosomal protein S12 methylthiotransferase RimO [Anaerohalosphaera lusitana]
MAKRKKQKQISVGFVALGCPKNLVDSEKMLAHAGQEGFVLSGDPDNADVVVINTCGFIEPAKQEAIGAICQAVDQKKKGHVRRVVVAGCLAQRMGKELLDEVKGIDAIVGLDERDKIAKVIRNVAAGRGKKVSDQVSRLPEKVSDDRGRLLVTPGHWAYLRISEGCNRKCSFCTIPSIRGMFRSKDEDAVVAEAQELVENGAVELSVIAQDSNYYGKDKGVAHGLSKLLDRLEGIEGLDWIRLMYLYPAGVDDELIERIAASEKVLNYVDMPIQHINNDILRSMKRVDTKEKTVALVEKLRKAMPDVVLRTTVITGFPGEGEKEFEELLDFIKWAKFDALGCFPFYPEPGTLAAELPGQVGESVRQERADEIMRVQQDIAFEKCRELIGKELVCLVDEPLAERQQIGRYYGQAPHIDSVCIVINSDALPGDFVRAKVIDTQDYDLVVEPVQT